MLVYTCTLCESLAQMIVIIGATLNIIGVSLNIIGASLNN